MRQIVNIGQFDGGAFTLGYEYDDVPIRQESEDGEPVDVFAVAQVNMLNTGNNQWLVTVKQNETLVYQHIIHGQESHHEIFGSGAQFDTWQLSWGVGDGGA